MSEADCSQLNTVELSIYYLACHAGQPRLAASPLTNRSLVFTMMDQRLASHCPNWSTGYYRHVDPLELLLGGEGSNS
jgi:hypothetical protein